MKLLSHRRNVSIPLLPEKALSSPDSETPTSEIKDPLFFVAVLVL